MDVILPWLLRRAATYPALAVGLLLVALSSVCFGLDAMVRGLELSLLLGITILALVIGWCLAGLRGWLASLVISALGIIVVILSAGGLTGHALDASRSLLAFSAQLIRPPYGQPDPGPALAGLKAFALQLGAVLIHLRGWLASLVALEPAFDPVAANLVWCLIFWMVAAWAAWWVCRYDRPLTGLAPALIVLASAAGITGQAVYFLVPVLAVLLLLLSLAGHHRRERHWQQAGVDYSFEVRTDLALSAVGLTAALTAAAIFVPSFSIARVADFVRDMVRDPDSQAHVLPESLGLKPAPGQASAFSALRSPGLPRRHLVGSGPELSQHIVMVIGPVDSIRRYYWRSATYDQYTGRGWATSSVAESRYRANVKIPGVSLPGQYPVEVVVRLAQGHEGLIYAPGRLVTVGSDFEVAWRSEADMFSAATAAKTYRVESFLSAPGEAQLQSAPNVYPEAIGHRYLRLPDSVPLRVYSLARELTAAEAAPFDRARAIESYLRAIPYTLDLPAPPPERDVADYFLFDLRRGYCDYYATAMVVLARAAGLPARMVVGYAAGTYDEYSRQYVVTEADAHSWVEVYFAEYGWVEFEPTGGRPPIERPQTAELAVTAESGLPPQGEAGGGPVNAIEWAGLAWALIIAALVLAGWGAMDRIRLGRLTPSQTLSVLYRRLAIHGRRLAVPIAAGDTPYEFADTLASRLAGPAQKTGWLKPALNELEWLVDSYVRTCYSPRRPDRAEQRQAIRIWRKLGWRLWGARLLGYAPRPGATPGPIIRINYRRP